MPLLSLRPQIETLWHSVDTDEREGVRTDEGGQTTQMRIERERLKRKREVKKRMAQNIRVLIKHTF